MYKVSCCLGWPRTYDVAEAVLELLILSPPPSAGITGVCYHAYFVVDVDIDILI